MSVCVVRYMYEHALLCVCNQFSISAWYDISGCFLPSACSVPFSFFCFVHASLPSLIHTLTPHYFCTFPSLPFMPELLLVYDSSCTRQTFSLWCTHCVFIFAQFCSGEVMKREKHLQEKQHCLCWLPEQNRKIGHTPKSSSLVQQTFFFFFLNNSGVSQNNVVKCVLKFILYFSEKPLCSPSLSLWRYSLFSVEILISEGWTGLSLTDLLACWWLCASLNAYQ